MQQGGERAPRLLVLEDGDHVVVGVARVDDQRQAGPARRVDVTAEHRRLIGSGRAVIEIVEPGFADGDALGMGGKADEIVGGDVYLLGGLVRMRADGTEDGVVAVGDGGDVGKATDAGADGHHQTNVGSLGAGDQLIGLPSEIGEVQMAVTIDDHDASIRIFADIVLRA